MGEGKRSFSARVSNESHPAPSLESSQRAAKRGTKRTNASLFLRLKAGVYALTVPVASNTYFLISPYLSLASIRLPIFRNGILVHGLLRGR